MARQIYEIISDNAYVILTIVGSSCCCYLRLGKIQQQGAQPI